MTNFEKFPRTTNSNHSTLTSWSRQQKIAMIAGFVLLGILLALSACSKQAPKTALVGISAPEAPMASAPQAPATPVAPAPVTPVAKQKTRKKHPAKIVTYNDVNTGVSFQYPRKYKLASGDTVQPEIDGVGPVPMNFVQPGGAAVAMVAVPSTTYPGTDFTTAFFHVNVNRSLSEQECSEFAVVDARNPDGEPMDAEKLRVGGASMDKTSTFAGDALKQGEAQYFHRYENGSCYEFVLGLGTAGYGTDAELKAVDRNEVFTRLEKILATVKIQAVEKAQDVVAKTAEATADESSK